jgi:protein TonB
LLQLSPVPATPYVEQLRIGVGRRTLAISLAVLIPALLLFMLLFFGPKKQPDDKDERMSVVSLTATKIADEAPEPSSPARERAEQQPVSPQESPPSERVEPLSPPAPEPMAAPTISPPAERPPSPANPGIAVRPSTGKVYGPPNSGGASSRDSERVGTAPNGEPLYAAAWYREPRNDELRGYLSTASGPGWGLIACRTAPDYRVEDCVALDEYPNGSQINRALLAAAWAFRVRPPRLGGRSLVGAWVRIRIDYGIEHR